jgi:hypothetical protein
MKTNIKIQAATIAIVALITSAQAQFTASDLVVLRDGTGSAPLSNAGTAIYLDQYTTSGSFVNSLAIPSTGSSALVNSGTAGSEGALTLSANGQYLVVAGYNTTAGSASIASSTSATVPRGVATVNASGNYTLAATTTTTFSGNNIRSGTTDGSGNFWAVGAVGGSVYFNSSTTTITNSFTSANNRVIQDIGGNLYFSTGSGSTHGIYQISGTPTTTGNTAVSLINTSSLGSTSPYDFAFNASLTLAYIADSDAYTTSSGMGGIEKWALIGGVWTFQYSLPVINTTGTSTTAGADGLAVDFSGANPIIYATSADGASLFDVVDTNATATASLLATAAANEAFRGLDFSPTNVPEPATLALAGMGLTALWGFTRRNRKS